MIKILILITAFLAIGYSQKKNCLLPTWQTFGCIVFIDIISVDLEI